MVTWHHRDITKNGKKNLKKFGMIDLLELILKELILAKLSAQYL
jgi:hypothetical protein